MTNFELGPRFSDRLALCRIFVALWVANILAFTVGCPIAQAQNAKPLVFDTSEITLRSSDARAQLLVHSPALSGGATVDLTRTVRFEMSQPGLISIDNQGLVTPLASGTLTVSASAEGYSPAQIPVRIELSGTDEPVRLSLCLLNSDATEEDATANLLVKMGSVCLYWDPKPWRITST